MVEVNQRILDVSAYVDDCYHSQVKAFGVVEFPFMKEVIRNNRVRTVLDIGTGEGTFIHRLASEHPEVSFTAIDIDEKLIASARLKSAGNLVFEQALFGESFRPGQYDLILSRFSVEHMHDVSGYLREALRRLTPGGHLLITEYFIDSLHLKNKEWLFFRDKELELYHKFGSHPRISLDLPGLMADAGFADIGSGFRHIAPSTVGAESFYGLVISYAHLYHSIEPEIWTPEVRDRVVRYCLTAIINRPVHEDILLISHTIGRRPA